MDFRVLGPLEVSERGRPLELRRKKQRALLAILLLHVGERLSVDALIEALWGEEPPKTAQKALQNYVAQLRRALGHDLIASREGGYQLAIEPEHVDLGRFERLLGEAHVLDGQEKVEKLRDAVALWRGPPLADLAYEPFAGHEAARLEELYVSTLEELVDAELVVGAGPELVDRLEALVAEHPYRERLRGQLMLALYRGGRQAEALETYRQARLTLVEELGLEPGDALRELEQAILRHDASLQPQRPTALASLAERRTTVTALFVELAVRERLDPELMRVRSAQALGRARAVLAAHGASVEQRAGEELLAIFGLPLAHEDDALRAARAALELEENGLRIALESGEVLAGTDDAGHGFVTGAAVAAARHLLERAAPGEVLVGETALALLGDAVLSEPSPGGPAARLFGLIEQEPDTVRPAAPLAGRRDELAALHAAFSNVVEERRARLVLLLGEAGIGKTRLAAELASAVEGRATIARGRCLSYGQALPYWPLVEALRSLGEPANAALERLLAGTTTSLDQLAVVIQRPLGQIAREGPLLVLLEDLQWAEPTLLELLELVTERSREAPILLLGLARPELLELQPDWALHETVLLGPLPRPDAESLLDALSEPPGAKKREGVLERGAGNPLFLEELSAFVAAGAEESQLPPRIQVLLQARLDLLPERERLVLTTAAVEGVVFHRGALDALLPEEEGLHDRLITLTRTLLIRPTVAELAGERAYRFRHQLIREAAYAELPTSERARLHERFADWLEEHGGGRAELEEVGAYHLEQAAFALRELGTRDAALETRAAEALAAAAERARNNVDRRTAAALWRRTLALRAEDDPQVPELELELALALTPLAEFREAAEVLEHAKRRAADPYLGARIRIAALHVRLSHGPDPDVAPEAMRRECATAIPLFEERRDHRALAYAWVALAEAEWFELQVKPATRAFEQAAGHAELAGHLARQILALEERAFFRGNTVSTFDATIEEAEGLVAQFPEDPIMAHCLNLGRSFAAYDRGDVAHARALAREAIAGIGRWGYPVIAAANRSVVGVLELLNGHPDEGERLLALAIEELERREERPYLSRVKAQLALLRVAQGRYREALELAAEAKRVAGPLHRYGRVHAEAVCVRACLGLGDIDGAKAAAANAVAVAEATDSLDHRALAQLARAEVCAAVGEPTAALEAAREASRLWTTLDRKLLGARAAELVDKLERAPAASGSSRRPRRATTADRRRPRSR